MRVDANIKPVDILLVEDNPGDVRLVREIFKEASILNKLAVVEDGAEALSYLHRSGCYSKTPLPSLIMLDLNLPKKNGYEVLEEIKQDPELKCIPVIVLTSSKAEEDINKSYELHANCYISKPVDLEEFMNVVKSIKNFWLNIAALPSKGEDYQQADSCAVNRG